MKFYQIPILFQNLDKIMKFLKFSPTFLSISKPSDFSTFSRQCSNHVNLVTIYIIVRIRTFSFSLTFSPFSHATFKKNFYYMKKTIFRKLNWLIIQLHCIFCLISIKNKIVLNENNFIYSEIYHCFKASSLTNFVSFSPMKSCRELSF